MDQPRRRPTPGDILSRAEAFDAKRERHLMIGDGRELSKDQQRVVEWAVMTGRLGPSDAREAVLNAGSMKFPTWFPEDNEAQRSVYAIRHHPRCVDPDDGGVSKYKKMVRAS
jgi:hypothetical protein